MGCIPYIIDKTFAWTCGTHTTLQCYWQMKTKKSWRNCDQVPNWHQVDLRWPRPRSPDITCSLVRRPKQFKTWALVIYLDRKKNIIEIWRLQFRIAGGMATPKIGIFKGSIMAHKYIYIYIHMYIYLFIYLSIDLFIYLFIHLSIYLFYLFIYI